MITDAPMHTQTAWKQNASGTVLVVTETKNQQNHSVTECTENKKII